MAGKTYSVEKSLQDLQVDIKNFTDEVQQQAKTALQRLAVQVHSKIIERSNSLKSTRSTYIQNLGMTNEGDELYVVYLKKGAQWIEDGVKQGEMIDRLLHGGKSPKVVQDGPNKGKEYKIIPFEHSKTSNNMSLAQQRIAAYAKEEIKRAGLDKVITRGGQPVLGRAATLNISGMPHGMKPKPVWKSALLSGLTIYQKEVKNAQGQTSIKRDIFTFRAVGEWQKGSGLWVHPGMKGLGAFAAVEKEVDQMWDAMIRDIVEQAATNSLKGK